MSKALPRRKILEFQVLDPVDWQEVWGPFQEHIGTLGEHNFNASDLGAMTPETDYETDVGGGKASTGIDITDARLAAAYSNDFLGGDRVYGTGRWVAIPGQSIPVRHDSGHMQVLFDTQVLVSLPSDTHRPVCTKFGVLRNGALVPESVIGGQDTGWEPANMEQGLGYAYYKASLSTSFPVPTGTSNLQAVFWLQTLEGKPISEFNVDAAVNFMYSNLRTRVRVR